MTVLQVKNLKKYFINKKLAIKGKKSTLTKAVDNISFEINEAEIIGLLGPNGAGKTTTTQMLLGTLTPTSGEIFYFNKNFSEHRSEILEKVNFSSAYIRLPWQMTVWENLDVFARLYGVKQRNQRIEKLLNEFEVSELKNKKINQLSAGQITRVLLAKAFINWPKIIILDEPTASLDPDIAYKVRKFLLKQQSLYNVAILITSHNMHEVQEICNRIIFLKKGRIIAQDTPQGLIEKIKKTKVSMNISKGKDKLETFLNLSKISFKIHDKKIIFEAEENEIPKILYKLSDAGIKYKNLEILRPTLEDFFLQITKIQK